MGSRAKRSMSDVSVKKTVTLQPREVIVLDIDKQNEILMRLKDEEDPIELYKQMLIDAWSVQEIKSQPSGSVRDLGPQAYEVIVHPSKREELPIVGYTPLYAKRFRAEKVEELETEVTVQDAPIRPKDVPRELISAQSSQMFLQLLEEINAKASYMTPFDKFVPHEDLLPQLDPAVAASLLASAEIDPVRGTIGDRKKEEESIEAQLNLPDFEELLESNDEIKKEMKENMRFWHTISGHVPAHPPSPEELKLLDFGVLCNMYMGSWGMDEDSMLLKFFYKFQYDDSWRARLKKGCHGILDECNVQKCGICPPVTDKDMSTMKDEHFFEIEDKEDYKNVVMALREEYNNKTDADTNWDFKQLIMNPVDSDLDSDGFVSDDDLILCRERRPSSKEWIKGKGPWVAPAKFDVPPPDEEDLRPCDVTCEDVEMLKFRDIIHTKDTATLEQETVELMKKKLERKKADERKGIYWRAKSNYLYRWPDFRRKVKK
uniref:DNA topoisomerase 2 n=1 Tax=Lygus hesperus TaxID=30085 RepID=A0A0A9ZJL3_LYGHE